MNDSAYSDDGAESGNPFDGEYDDDDDEIEDCAPADPSDSCSETSCQNNGSIGRDEVQSPVPTKQKFFSRYNPKKYIKRMTRSGSTASSASGSSGGGALIDSVKRAASAAVTSATGVATGVTSAAMTASSTGKVQQWNSVVTIVLIDGKNLVARDDDGFSDPYVKFRLGNERYKSKTKPKTLSPTWYEQFDLYMYDDQPTCLEISVFDRDQGARDDFMGRSKIDLADYPRDQTHHLELVLEDQAGTIRLLVTVSGTRVTAVDSHTQRVTTARERTEIVRKYGLFRSLKNLKDVGWMQVKVLKAQDLKSADIGGKSDPYCVLELVNDRLQTHTEYKTLFPEWGKVFTFNVKDIHSVLEVTVYDEDPNKKIEFLGKVAIPLLRVKRGQVQRYELRDQKLLTTVRGSIDLEIDLIFNDFKAAVRTFNPKEKKYMQPEPRFKIAALKNNVDRVYKIAEAVLRFGEFMQSCFSWQSTPRSISAFFVFLVIVWNFELYMLPLTLIIILLKNLIYLQFSGGASNCREEEHVNLREEDDDDDSKGLLAGEILYRIALREQDSAKGQTLREKLQSIQDVCLVIQERMDMVASLFERIKNAFRWSVPWLSALAIIVLTIATVLLYHIPIRYIILVWGVNKFTKKLRSPNAIDNNEVLDYLSRVPSDKELDLICTPASQAFVERVFSLCGIFTAGRRRSMKRSLEMRVFLKLNKRVLEQTGFTVYSRLVDSVDYLLPTVDHQPSTAAAVQKDCNCM